MTGRGSRMSPKERYLRSVYLVYQVCTDVVRHYFDVKFPTERLVQDLLQKRPEFEKKEKKIPNYQWIQLYPEALFRADINIAEKYIEPCDKTAYKEFAHRMKTIFQYIFDTVDGEQKVNLVKTSSFGPGEILSLFEISSRYNPDGSKIKKALEQLVNGGNVDASLEISDSPDGFSMNKQEDIYIMVINLTKEYDAALGQTDSQEFKMMAKRIERILHFLYDSVPGTQLFKVEEFRSLPSTNCISAKCKLTSVDLKNEKKLRDTIKRSISERRLGKTLTTICSPNGFSFKDVIVFESEIKVDEKFSKNLANSDHPDFKALVDRVQPIIKGLYDSSNGEQDVEIVRCRRDEKPDTMFVVFHLISHGNNDEEELRKVTEREIRTGSLSLSYGIIADGFRFEPNKCTYMFNVKVKLAEKNEDYKLLANPTSKTFKSFKEKVEPEILRLYDQIDGVQEIDIDKYKIESTGALFIIFKLTSRDCSDESTLKEPIETQIRTGLLGSSLKVSTSDMVFQKLAEKVIYQVCLNVEVQFTEKLKTKHSAEFMAFSKFVQTVLNTHYEHDEKIPGMQDIHVVECRQGPTVTSTNVILEIISHVCTNKEVVRQSIENLIAVGKLELTLKTSATDFTFKIVRGSKPVSSINFDLSLLITLLRNDSNVEPPETGRYDDLPSKDDKTDGAQIATIKHYRNDLAHASEAKKNEHEFDCLWSRLENAVRILGKDKFMKAVDDASTMKLDSSTEVGLIRMVQQDRQILQLEEDVTKLYQRIEKLTKQTEDQSASTQVEISEIKEKIGKKEEQILEIKTDMQTFHTELHRIEKKFDEKFRGQDERNDQQDEMNRNMESGIEENRRDIQRLDPQSTVRQLRSHVPSTDQLNTGSGESQLSTENFIKLHFEKLPKELKVGYYDVMILYSSDDRSEAQKFCEHLNRDIYPKEQGKIKAVLYDGPEFEGISLSKFEHFDKGFERCTFTFLYLTKQFVECDWSKFVAQACLLEAISNPDKEWCFVPVNTVQRADYKIPIYIKPLKAINYYNPDEFYKKCVKRLIGDKLYQRKENDKIQEEKCFQFLVKKVREDKANEQRLLNEYENQQQKLEMRSLNSNRE